ncbi:hypothetical protein BJ912DRAFT_920902 [Pholiota molesta]|nr:hypothetical protein BJ912DRAFT_920902 [Pholiota molesta]
MSTPPTSTQVLVIGGGPAGSYAATVLAERGSLWYWYRLRSFLGKPCVHFAIFFPLTGPRYHIGESMLPSIRPFMRFIDAEEKVSSHGFTFKRGVATKLRQDKREGYSDFIAMGHDKGAWNVIRSEFDDLLPLLSNAVSFGTAYCSKYTFSAVFTDMITSSSVLSHASKCGAIVQQETTIKEIRFDSHAANRPVAATWNKPDGRRGRNGIMSTKYLKNRTLNKSLNNLACWGYWEQTECYMPNSTEKMLYGRSSDEGAWGNQTHRKGTLRNQANRCSKMGNDQSYAAKVMQEITSESQAMLESKAFIDPFFSSGVHLAFTGALSAAITICAAIRVSVASRKRACGMMRKWVLHIPGSSSLCWDIQTDAESAFAHHNSPELLSPNGPIMTSAELDRILDPGDIERS